MLLMRQFWLSGYFALSTQFQVLHLVMVLGLIILQLCELIIVFIFGLQVQLIFVVFLLNNLWNLLWGGKCLSNQDKKCFPTFLRTSALYGGLSHITFLFRFLVVLVFCLMFCWYCISCIYSAFVSASLYGLIEFLIISLFAGNCDNLNSIDFGSYLIMMGGDFLLLCCAYHIKEMHKLIWSITLNVLSLLDQGIF